ncbi:hypothetical protein [Rickettsia endosymbiont of Nabis limbatus]|uniref:hypothetical protein n=1 Tax=Rickettsia endosymbiont of Nabis limbatus TaxID=3066268 RepID=UPI003AF3EE74
MSNFFLILLNRAIYSPKLSDLIHTCDSDIYFQMKYYTGSLINYNTNLYSLINKHCSVATYSNITSGILPQFIIYRSSEKNTTDVLKLYNNTYTEYETFNLNTHILCTIKIKDIGNWSRSRLKILYDMICHHESLSTPDNCVSIHNALTSYHMEVTLNMMSKTFCIPNFNSITLEINISNTTSLLQIQNRALEQQNIFLKQENNYLKLELDKAIQSRDTLSKKVVNLKNNINLLENQLNYLISYLTNIKKSEKELEVKLNETTNHLQKANHSVDVLTNVLEKLKNNSSIITNSKDAYKYFDTQRANYTDYVQRYENHTSLMNESLENVHQNIDAYEQKIKSLQSQIKNKDIELNDVYTLLNITISYIEHIYDNLKAESNYSENIVKHDRTKRNINKQYNEAKDDYTYKQIMDNFYEVRIADSEQKVEEILPISAPIGDIPSTNKLIAGLEISSYPLAVGNIGLGVVALYFINKYCFSITKWLIMGGKCIARTCEILAPKIRDNGIVLTHIEENEENIYEEAHNEINMIGQDCIIEV